MRSIVVTPAQIIPSDAAALIREVGDEEEDESCFLIEQPTFHAVVLSYSICTTSILDLPYERGNSEDERIPMVLEREL